MRFIECIWAKRVFQSIHLRFALWRGMSFHEKEHRLRVKSTLFHWMNQVSECV